jgi:hypothetical protein
MSVFCPRESVRTNGSEEVSRRETKRVFLARAGRRSTNSRGPEAATKDDGLPGKRGVSLRGRRKGAQRLGRAEGHVRDGRQIRGGCGWGVGDGETWCCASVFRRADHEWLPVGH